MKCKFCNGTTRLSHYENNREVVVYECIGCPMQIFFHYLFDATGPVIETEPHKIIFMVDRNSKTYMWTNDQIKGYSYIEELKIGSHPTHDATVVKLPKLVDVTPETVRKKLSFYMVFA